ncbi:MAG: hypothetical protein JST83_11590, partial [Bacteroidetes bacterium]|nr:hypothetical protein [Bacteroidota bacterium]
AISIAIIVGAGVYLVDSGAVIPRLIALSEAAAKSEYQYQEEGRQ